MSHRVGANDVAVLGCGNMGSSLARALLASDKRVAVWNRTPERAQPLLDDGAEVHVQAASALLDAPLAIFCLGSTDDVRQVLSTIAPEDLVGRTVLNVTSGTPDDAQRLAALVLAQGSHYLDAAILCYPEQIGTEPARILVAGDEDLWKVHENVVRTLAGASTYVGPDHRAANVLDTGLVGAFYISSLVSFIEAARFICDSGVSREVLTSLVGYAVSQLERELQQVLERIGTGDFTTDQATLSVYSDASNAFALAMGAPVAAPMIHSTAACLRRAIESGLGDEDIAALFSFKS